MKIIGANQLGKDFFAYQEGEELSIVDSERNH